MNRILIPVMEKITRWAFIHSFHTLGSFIRCVVICSDVIRSDVIRSVIIRSVGESAGCLVCELSSYWTEYGVQCVRV